MQGREFNYNGRTIFYRTKGEGPVVVLLHGFGEDSMIWKNQFDLFSNHRLIIPDLPGSGRSEAIEDMSIEGMAEAVAALVDGRALLIGHSMGGYITLAFAEKYPERLSAFGLFHSTAFADSEEKKVMRRKGIEAMKADGAEVFLKTFVPGLYSPVTKEEKPELIDEHFAGVRNFSTEALVTYFEAMIVRPDRTDVLKKSEVPVLFVMGKQDANVPMEEGLKQCHLPQTAYIHLLNNSAHAGMVEETEETNKILIAFVKAGHDTA